jgi:lipopolysaccharide export system permease protein
MGLAVWAILGGAFSRLGYGRRIALAGGVAAVVRILGFVAVSASETASWMNILQYMIPALATVWALGAVFRGQISRRASFPGRPLARRTGVVSA